MILSVSKAMFLRALPFAIWYRTTWSSELLLVKNSTPQRLSSLSLCELFNFSDLSSRKISMEQNIKRFYSYIRWKAKLLQNFVWAKNRSKHINLLIKLLQWKFSSLYKHISGHRPWIFGLTPHEILKWCKSEKHYVTNWKTVFLIKWRLERKLFKTQVSHLKYYYQIMIFS